MDWLLAIIGIALAVGGWFMGRRASKFSGNWWMMGFVVPFLFILIVAMARRMPKLEFMPPFSWLMAGRLEFALMGAAVTLLFSTLLPKLPTKDLRKLIVVLMVLVVLQALTPFLAPAILRGRLAALETKWHQPGICQQSRDYTCGPASVVTALHRLGINATESELALAAHTTQFTGTEPDDLAAAINHVYGRQGVVAEYRWFDKLEDLPRDGALVLRIQYGFLMDHWVAVLEMKDEKVIVGDPYIGKWDYSWSEFGAKWRHTGVWMRRLGEK